MKIPFLARISAGAGVVAIVLSSFGSVALGQCPTPDQLDDIGDCIFATPVLPEFPPVQTLSTEICWVDCHVESQFPVLAKWGRLRPAQTRVIPPLCTIYLARLDLVDPVTGAAEWGGAIRCFYSRTWVEFDSVGRVHQVWRFLTNGDLRPQAAAGLPPCPVPPCASGFANRVHFFGHLDVSVACATGVRSFAWSLHHDCDSNEHGPDSARPGAFHPNRTYTFVGPGASFVSGNVTPEPTVMATSEAVRQLALRRLEESPPSPMICLAEQTVSEARLLSPGTEFCPCGADSSGYFKTPLTLNADFGAIPRIFPGGSLFTSRGLGRWTDPAAFPGLESLRANWGSYATTFLCSGLVPEETVYCFGVTTLGGFQANQLTFAGVGGPLPQAFVDQGNSLDSRFFGPVNGTKYVSSFIMNLNF